MTASRVALTVTLGLTLLVAPLAVEAQKSEKKARVGILGIGTAPSPQELAKSVSMLRSNCSTPKLLLRRRVRQKNRLPRVDKIEVMQLRIGVHQSLQPILGAEISNRKAQ